MTQTKPKKTNKHWYPYEEDGCYYKLEEGVLLQCPMNIHGSADEESFCEVDWYYGLTQEELPRMKEIVKELEEKE